MEKVHVLDNNLLRHKIVELRSVDTKPSRFRQLAKEIAMMETYEALRDWENEIVEVTTPMETYTDRRIDEERICIVPILRAGLGMEEGSTVFLPNAHVGHIGMKRDEITHQAIPYYANFPKGIADMKVIILDPMLATGGSAIDAIEQMKAMGVNDITFLCIIAAPEGVKTVNEKFPEVPIYIGSLDRELNENAYILPGLGDAGDRVFNTVG